MQSHIKSLIEYSKAAYWNGIRFVFTIFSVLSITTLFFPKVVEWLGNNIDLAKISVAIIILIYCFITNFLLYRKLTKELAKKQPVLDSESLLFYSHEIRPYNAVKMIYVGSEILRDLEINISYKDKEGIRQNLVVNKFFPENQPDMLFGTYKCDYLRPNQAAYFHLLNKKSTSDGKATVSARFVGATSRKSVHKEQDFKLRKF